MIQKGPIEERDRESQDEIRLSQEDEAAGARKMKLRIISLLAILFIMGPLAAQEPATDTGNTPDPNAPENQVIQVRRQ